MPPTFRVRTRAYAALHSAVALVAAIAYAGPAHASDADGANEMALLVGNWECSGSAPASTTSEIYRRVNDTTMALAFVERAHGISAPVEERFTFDRASGVWSLDAQKYPASGGEHLTAPAWSAQNWLFTGAQVTGGISYPVRIAFAYSPPDTFLRERQVRRGDRWVSDGSSLCRRAPLEARYDDETVTPDAVAETTPPPFRVALGMVAQPAQPAPPAGTGADRAYSLTQGVWNCDTFGGARATHTYTRDAAGGIKLHNVLRIANRDYAIDETYRFDKKKQSWTTTTLAEAYMGVAGRWTSDKWVFDGSMPLGNRRVPAQMIYSTLGDGAFRRDFIRVGNGERQTFAAETCRRR